MTVGALFMAPIAVFVVILNKVFTFASKTLAPLAAAIPGTLGLGGAKTTVLALLLVVLLCFWEDCSLKLLWLAALSVHWKTPCFLVCLATNTSSRKAPAIWVSARTRTTGSW